MSHRGVSTEEIARLVGHASTRTTEVVYRRELRPVITTGAEIMDKVFGPGTDLQGRCHMHPGLWTSLWFREFASHSPRGGGLRQRGPAAVLVSGDARVAGRLGAFALLIEDFLDPFGG
jgi:hypothetical protein